MIMLGQITLNSFQGWLSYDKRSWQKWSFWNSKNIQYRKDSGYIELSSWTNVNFTLDATALGIGTPAAVTYWGTYWTIVNDLVVISGNGKVITPTGGVTFTMTTGAGCVNIAEANNKKYVLSSIYLHEFVSTTSVTPLVAFWTTENCRPVLNFYWDLIIGDGYQVCRYNKDGTLVSYSSSIEWPVIGGLGGKVISITQIWPNVYVWTTDYVNTYLYIWDWLTSRPSQKIEYKDVSVRNVAVLWNQHYWWGMKWSLWSSPQSIRYVYIGDSYQPTLIAKSDYTTTPFYSNIDTDANRLLLNENNYWIVWPIETINDMVILPWVRSLYTLGQYFPWNPYSLNREFSFSTPDDSGDASPYFIHTTASTGGSRDVSSLITFLYRSASNVYNVGIINLWNSQSSVPLIYSSSWFIETLEFDARDMLTWENNKKLVVPFYLPHSSTSIVCYIRVNGWSYNAVKTINTTTYWTGFGVAEIPVSETWRNIQMKFELITSNASYTPRLYKGATLNFEWAWKI